MSENISKREFVSINDIKVYLFDPLESEVVWFGQEEISRLLVAAWLSRSSHDPVMSPVLIGPPGSGKTTLARNVAQKFKRPVYIMNCTSDMRPEDLLIMTVLSPSEKFRYQASGLVSAMITGGICILDEANRMNEKSWASLASLLDDRRYIDSITAGIRIHAHPEFRIVSTMNEDSSTFNIPDYIENRLKPVFPVSFPTKKDMKKILAHHVPDADDDLQESIVQYLSEKKENGILEDYSTRDAIHITKMAIKLSEMRKDYQSTDTFIESIAPYIVQVEEQTKPRITNVSWI